jgi:hypothetical protein
MQGIAANRLLAGRFEMWSTVHCKLSATALPILGRLF